MLTTGQHKALPGVSGAIAEENTNPEGEWPERSMCNAHSHGLKVCNRKGAIVAA